jgi:hypothetical protein
MLVATTGELPASDIVGGRGFAPAFNSALNFEL